MRVHRFVAPLLMLLCLAAPPLLPEAPLTDIVVRAGSNYVAKSAAGEAVKYNGTDYGAAVQAAIDDAVAIGANVTVKPGLYVMGATMPLVPRNLTRMLTISGEGAVVRMTSPSVWPFAVARVSSGDFYRNFTIRGFTVDVNNLAGTGGFYLFGVKTFYTDNVDINWSNVWFIGNAAVNVPNAPYWTFIGVDSFASNASDATAMVVNGVHFKDNQTDGGCYGVRVTSGLVSGVDNGTTNITGDDVTVDHQVDDFTKGGSVPVQAAYQPCTGGVHIGGATKFNRVSITNSVSKAPFDNCFEINNAYNPSTSGNYCLNPYSGGWTLSSFSPSFDASKQTWVASDDVVEFTSPPMAGGSASQSIGWGVGVNQSSPNTYSFGDFVGKGCKFLAKGITNGGVSTALNIRGGSRASDGLRSFSMDDFTVSEDQVWNSASATFPDIVYWDASLADWNGDGTLDNVKASFANLRMDSRVQKGGGSGAHHQRGMSFYSGGVDLALNNASINFRVSGTIGASDAKGIFVGQTAAAAFNAMMDGVAFVSKGDMAAGSPFLVFTTFASIPDKVHIVGLDTTGTVNPSSSVDIDFGATGLASKVELIGPKLRSVPAGTKKYMIPQLSADTVQVDAAVAHTDSDGTLALSTWNQVANAFEWGHSGTSNIRFYPDSNQLEVAPAVTDSAAALMIRHPQTGSSVSSTEVEVHEEGTGVSRVLIACRVGSTLCWQLRFKNDGTMAWYADNGATDVLDMPNSSSGSFQCLYGDCFANQWTAPLFRVKEVNQSYYLNWTYDVGVASHDLNVKVAMAGACDGLANGGKLTLTPVDSTHVVMQCAADVGGGPSSDYATAAFMKAFLGGL